MHPLHIALYRIRDSSTAAALMVITMILALTWMTIALTLLHRYHYPPPKLRYQSYSKGVRQVIDRLAEEHRQNRSHTRFPFRYLINEPWLCHGKVHVLNIVPTHPHHSDLRSFIRSSWAKPSHLEMSGVKTIFLIGTTSSSNVTREVFNESSTFRDVLLMDFEHPSDDQTHATLTMLHWKLNYCPRAKWLLKTRANVVVNTLAMSDLLLACEEDFLCLMEERGSTCRGADCSGGKDDFSGQTPPPPHCSPHAYAINSDIARDLYFFANKTHQHSDENILFTGVWPKPLQPSYHPLKSKQKKFGKTALYTEGWNNLQLLTIYGRLT